MVEFAIDTFCTVY